MTQGKDGVDRVWELIDKVKIAMVVTHDDHLGNLHARPMESHPAREENAIYFLTDAGSGKVGEIRHDSGVCLCFADTKAQYFVSVTGKARLSDDRARIKRLWSFTDNAFWDGENDPAIRILRIEPIEAEYWEGSATLVTYVKMFVAQVTANKPSLHDNEKVPLSSEKKG